MKNYSYIFWIFVLLFSGTMLQAQEEQSLDEIIEKAENNTDRYSPIEISLVPEVIGTAVSRDFQDTEIVEAYKDENENYRLLLMVATEPTTVYASSTGEWFEPKL